MSDLTAAELDKVRSILKREPNETENGIFTVMWSEHCSYKSSRIHLRKLPTKSDRVLVGAGRRTRALSTSAGVMRSRSRLNRTIILVLLSRFKARRRASAASCGTSLRWGRGLWR